MRDGNQLIDVSSAACGPSSTIPIGSTWQHFPYAGTCSSLIQFYSITLIKNLILMMRKQSCLFWWNVLMPLMDVNWFDTKLIKLSPVTVKGVGPSFALTGRWWGTSKKVILDLILMERSMLLIRIPKGQSEKELTKVNFSFVYWCLHEFIDSTNSFIFRFVCMWFVSLYQFNAFMNSSNYVCFFIHSINSFRCWHHGSQGCQEAYESRTKQKNTSCKLLLIQLLVKLYQIVLLH